MAVCRTTGLQLKSVDTFPEHARKLSHFLVYSVHNKRGSLIQGIFIT